MIGDPNRITRQARILPSIFKSYIGQVENLYLLICGVNTCGLRRGRPRKKGVEKRKGGGCADNDGEEEKRTNGGNKVREEEEEEEESRREREK